MSICYVASFLSFTVSVREFKTKENTSFLHFRKNGSCYSVEGRLSWPLTTTHSLSGLLLLPLLSSGFFESWIQFHLFCSFRLLHQQTLLIGIVPMFCEFLLVILRHRIYLLLVFKVFHFLPTLIFFFIHKLFNSLFPY